MLLPPVSVHVVTYNQRDYIVETIESALAQDYPNLEIVVADDGSTDGTAMVAERYTKQALYLRQANAGTAAARNLGLRAAAGEFVAFLDADDLWHPEKLTRQMAL